MKPEPQAQRQFAVDVVGRLRQAGFEALWAGGCVRDHLLSRTPKDYDVATNAPPDAVRSTFGHRRTLAIGAAFGVIAVVGSREQGNVEVTTFRQDGGYTDGRRPDGVTFSNAEQDAQRRDFTINGLFFDPLENRVIDYVGGIADLGQRVVRAIGDPSARFTEDKLRMLRAVRMAATFDFQLEAATADAVRRMAAEVLVVSAERIAQEMRMLLTLPTRVRGLELLREAALLAPVLPEGAALAPEAWAGALQLVGELHTHPFALVLAALLADATNDAQKKQSPVGSQSSVGSQSCVGRVAARWKLSNEEHDLAAWLVANQRALCDADRQPWSRIQRLFTHDGIGLLVELHAARARLSGGERSEIEFCRRKLAEPLESLDPQPLLTGNDLITLGVPRGKHYATLLDAVRNAQLDNQIGSHADALTLAARLWAEHERRPPSQ